MFNANIEKRNKIFNDFLPLVDKIVRGFSSSFYGDSDNLYDVKSYVCECLLVAIDRYLSKYNNINNIGKYFKKIIKHACINGSRKVRYYYPDVRRGTGKKISIFGYCTDKPVALSFEDDGIDASQNIELMSVRNDGYNNILKGQKIKKAREIIHDFLLTRTETRYKVFLDIYYYDGYTRQDIYDKYGIDRHVIHRYLKKIRKEVFEKYPELKEFA